MNKLLTAMEQIYQKIPKKLIDYLYVAAFFLVFVYDYAYLTRFDRDLFRPLYIAGTALAGIVLVLRFLNVKNERRVIICFAILCLAIGGSYYLARHSYYFLVLAMLMVGALRVDDKKIFAVYLFAATFFFAVMLVHFLTITPDWESWPSVHFGSINTTDCQGMIFFLFVAWMFYRDKEVQYVELLTMGAIVLWFWWYTKAEINMYCSMTCLLIAGFRKCGFTLQFKARLKSQQIIGYIISFSFLICAAVIILLAIQYDPDNEKWQKLNLLLHRRLRSPHNAFLKYPPRLWGTEYVQVGSGYSPGFDYYEMLAKYGATFIDSSYPNILINHGYLVFALIMGAMSFVSFRYAKRGELFKVLLLAVVAIDCAAESHLKEISCNVWLILPFANICKPVHTSTEESSAIAGIRQ